MTASITMLDIDETENCNADYLEIRDTSATGKLIGVYCGKQAPPALLPSNTYWVKFRSDNDGVGRGFLLEYRYGNLSECINDNKNDEIKRILFLVQLNKSNSLEQMA